MLAWIFEDKGIEPHVPVWDRTQRNDESLSSTEFQWNEKADEYRCPQGHALRRQWRAFSNPRTHLTKADTIIYRSSQSDCTTCPMKERAAQTHRFARSRAASMNLPVTWRGESRTTVQYQRSRYERKKVEMLFARLKRILRLDRLRLRGLSGASDEFTLAAALKIYDASPS